MSTCYKCGRVLPGMEVECEACPSLFSDQPSASNPPPTASLAPLDQSTARGMMAAFELVDSVVKAGRPGCIITILGEDGSKFEVTVKRIA